MAENCALLQALPEVEIKSNFLAFLVFNYILTIVKYDNSFCMNEHSVFKRNDLQLCTYKE
jgi:hypothetical protein